VNARPNQDDTSAGRLERPKPANRKEPLGRFPSFILEPRQPTFADIAVRRLVSSSVAQFTRGIRVPEPTLHPSSLQFVPRLNEISRHERLPAACVWHRRAFTSKGCQEGRVFINYKEQSDIQAVIKTHWVAQQYKNAYQSATRYQPSAERGMEPIWVVDVRVLRQEDCGR
jgi:hypothetical protein